MTYDEMKTSHEAQIEALLVDDYDTLLSMFDQKVSSWKCHYDVWGNTPRDNDSLFAALPGTRHCLTQIKGDLDYKDNPHGVNAVEDMQWVRTLDLSDNILIPGVTTMETRFTRAQLEEFSRLQLLANFPEGGDGP